VLAGLAFIPLLGIESDEALFANVFYTPRSGGYAYRIGHAELPLMMLSYLGTLKSWIYRPIFKVFGMGATSARVPVILAGAASVWLLYQLLVKISGRRAALGLTSAFCGATSSARALEGVPPALLVAAAGSSPPRPSLPGPVFPESAN
jgi:hypothetical protein